MQFENLTQLLQAYHLNASLEEGLVQRGYSWHGPYFQRDHILQMSGEAKIIQPPYWKEGTLRTAPKSELVTAQYDGGQVHFLLPHGIQGFDQNNGLFLALGNQVNDTLIINEQFGFDGMMHLFVYDGTIRSPTPLKTKDGFHPIDSDSIKKMVASPSMMFDMNGFSADDFELEGRMREQADGITLFEYHAARKGKSNMGSEQYFIYVQRQTE